MISNPFYLLSLLMSSWLAFITMACAVELTLKVFGIRHYRMRSTLRILPFISLAVDLIFNRFSVSYLLNPLSCASCIQKLGLEFIFPNLKEHLIENQISLVQYLGAGYHSSLYVSLFYAFMILSMFLVLCRLAQAYFMNNSLNSVIDHAHQTPYRVKNSNLAHELTLKKASIYLSDEIEVPMAAYRNRIIIPQSAFLDLSEQELEVVIAHELEHLKNKDLFTRVFTQLISTFFWWLPLTRWLQRIEHEQEMACDQDALKYGFQPESIASALFKVAKQTKIVRTHCYFAGHPNPTMARIQHLLGLYSAEQNCITGINFFGVCMGVFLITACIAWA